MESSSSSLAAPIDPQAEIARLTLANEDLNRRGNALLLDHQQLQAQHALLQSAGGPAAPVVAPFVRAGGVAGPNVPPMPYRPTDAKGVKPKEFTGAIGPAVDVWLRAVNNYVEWTPEAFPNDTRKIKWAEMYLSTEVTSWLNAARVELAAEGKLIDTWVKFEALLRERYQPMEAAVFARQRLDKMSQTGSVSAYNEYFLATLQYLPHMDVGDRIHHFMKGLKESVRGEVIRRGPKSVSEAMHFAIGAEAYSRQSYNLSSHGSSRYSRSSAQYGPSSGSTDMDLSNVNYGPDHLEDERDSSPSPSSAGGAQLLALEQKLEKMYALMSRASGSNRPDRRQDSRGLSGGGTRVNGVSRDDYIKCREKNVCLKCKEQGHVAKDCTKAFKPVPSNW